MESCQEHWYIYISFFCPSITVSFTEQYLITLKSLVLNIYHFQFLHRRCALALHIHIPILTQPINRETPFCGTIISREMKTNKKKERESQIGFYAY